MHDRLDKLCSALAEAQLIMKKKFDFFLTFSISYEWHNDIGNDKKGHNIVNEIMSNIMNDKKDHNIRNDKKAALLISQTAYLLSKAVW